MSPAIPRTYNTAPSIKGAKASSHEMLITPQAFKTTSAIPPQTEAMKTTTAIPMSSPMMNFIGLFYLAHDVSGGAS